MLLLDEIEKAHPDIFNILLQVMDHATLTDNNGRKADFRNVILIMTTNAGAQEMAARRSASRSQDHATEGERRSSRLFSPEFRNRLDAMIPFERARRATIERVVDKFMVELEASSSRRASAGGRRRRRAHWLAEKGYDPKIGARPMARLIQEQIKRALADEILFGELANGGHVDVTSRKGSLRSAPAGARARPRRLELIGRRARVSARSTTQ